MVRPLPDYKNLDLSGEARQAAFRMEVRAAEPASQAMFEALVRPLLISSIQSVLEIGCGTAALSRRIARAASQAVVYASDKSEGMLQAARNLIEAESIPNIRLVPWDITDKTSFPFPIDQFDLIISSVVIPYLDEEQTFALVQNLAAHLSPGGTLAFIEQDLLTDSIYFPRFELFTAILKKDARKIKPTLALGLRPLLRKAGLAVLPRQSFLWTDDHYGTYTRDVLERFADAALDRGDIRPEEREEWNQTLKDLAESGDFYYGLVYHRIAGRREPF